MSESTNNHGFTTKEMEFLMTALKHADGGSFKVCAFHLSNPHAIHILTHVQFDADAVAKELGYKDGSIARVRWNSINRNKIKGAVGGIDKASPAKKNIKPKKAAGEEDGDGECFATPVLFAVGGLY